MIFIMKLLLNKLLDT